MPWYVQNTIITAGTAATIYWPYNQTRVIASAATTATVWWGGQTSNLWWPEMQQSILPPSAAHTARRLRDIQQAHRAQERAIQRRTAEMERHSNDVQQRARELLLRNLTPEQRDSFNAHKFFVVEGRSGDRYRIEDRGHMVGNIAVLTHHVGMEVVRHRLCGHCDRSIPLADQLLAQKLMIEGAEDEFLRIANRHAA